MPLSEFLRELWADLRALGVGVAILFVVACVFVISHAHAHQAWSNGEPIPKWVSASCCGPADAHLLDPGDYFIDAAGFHVRGVDMAVSLDRVQPSPDGRVWAFWNESLGPTAPIYCVFYFGGT